MTDSDTIQTLHRTPLFEEHLRLGARMVPFAGWEMPVQYAGIVEEHEAVRQRAGMFDVSHMGRYEVHGPEAARFLRFICTWDMTRLVSGEGHYAAACREDGGILDDVYVFCLEPERYLLVCNASNADKIRGWMERHISGFEAWLVDRHYATAMIAVQGPEAIERLAGLIGREFIDSMRPRRCAETRWRGQSLFASRTGYTGEDGLELVLDGRQGPELWQALLERGVVPCGLGARDTLRLEAALLLYGNDMDETVNPWEAGLGWVITLDDSADFIGKEALVRLSEAGPEKVLVCLKAEERGIIRHDCPILRSGERIGKVTSGGYSPTLGVSIGIGFVPPALSDEGTKLAVDVRGKPLTVRVVPRPFYKAPKKR